MDHKQEGLLDLRLNNLGSRFAQVAITNSPWFVGLAIRMDSVRQGAVLHPSMMNEIDEALDGRSPRHKVVGEELRLTFDLIDPSEEENVKAFARELSLRFGVLAECTILYDENMTKSSEEQTPKNVTNLFKDKT